MTTGNAVGIYRTVADRDRFYAAVRSVEGGRHGLSEDELKELQARLWRAWCEWGDTAPLIPAHLKFPAELPRELEPAFIAAAKASSQEMLEIWRAAIIRERINREAELILEARARS